MRKVSEMLAAKKIEKVRGSDTRISTLTKAAYRYGSLSYVSAVPLQKIVAGV